MIILSEVDKDKYHIISSYLKICHFRHILDNELFTNQKQVHRYENMTMITKEERVGERNK